MFTTKELNLALSKALYETVKPTLDFVESLTESELKERHSRLYHCNAYVVPIDGLFVLRSYSTAVAWYDPEINAVYVLGRYSATTYQHIRKFEDYLYYDKCYEKLFSRGKEVNLQLVDNWGCYDCPIRWNAWYK